MLETNRLSRENFPKQTPKKEKQFIGKERCFLAPGFVFTLALHFHLLGMTSGQGAVFWLCMGRHRLVSACLTADVGCSCEGNEYRWLVQSSWAVLEEIDISNPTGVLVACL